MTFLLGGNHDGIVIEQDVLLIFPLYVNTRISRLSFAPAEDVGESVRVIVARQVEHRKLEEICHVLTVLVFSEVLDDRTVVPRVQEPFQLACFRAQWIESE